MISGSVAALRNLLSSDPSSRVILSGDEWWLSGADDIPNVLAKRNAAMDLTDQFELHRVEAFEAGNVGWSACIITMFRPSGETVTLRSTMVWVVEDGVWKGIQAHTSAGVPEEQVFGYEIASGPAALIDSLTEASIDVVRHTVGVGGTVTLMFTDVVDSTHLSQTLGDADWTDQIQQHFAMIREVVQSHHGTVVKTLGDGAMNAFSSAQQATSAAIEIQRRVAATSLRVRIGIHTGDAISVDGDYLGTAVNKAARVASAAGEHEILLSSTTSEMIDRRDFEFGPERRAELKGLTGTHLLIPLIVPPAP